MTNESQTLHVIWDRNQRGALDGIQIWDGTPHVDASALLLDTSAGHDPGGQLDGLLGLACDYYRVDPYSDLLPSDDSVIAAYLEHLT